MYGPRGGGIAERDGSDGADRHRQRHAGQGVRRDGWLHRRLRECCDAIRSYAPGFIFTTSLAPAVVAGALASIRHLKSEPARAGAASGARADAEAASERGRRIPVMDNPSHIVPVFVGDPVLLQDDHGHAARSLRRSTCSRSTIRPCRRGTERLRLTPTPQHTDADIDHLVASLSALWAECPISQMPMAESEAAE